MTNPYAVYPGAYPFANRAGSTAGSAMPGGSGLPAVEEVPQEEQESRTQDFAVRETLLRRQAAAASAVRGDNDADMLGSSSPRRRREASRQLLG